MFDGPLLWIQLSAMVLVSRSVATSENFHVSWVPSVYSRIVNSSWYRKLLVKSKRLLPGFLPLMLGIPTAVEKSFWATDSSVSAPLPYKGSRMKLLGVFVTRKDNYQFLYSFSSFTCVFVRPHCVIEANLSPPSRIWYSIRRDPLTYKPNIFLYPLNS